VSLPSEVIDVPGPGNVTLPVLVQTPSIHSHGTLLKFLVEGTSESDPGSVGRIELGIFYLQPPQPAGHHDTVWFHSRVEARDQVAQAAGTVAGDDGVSLFMNALEPKDEPQDDGVADEGRPSGNPSLNNVPPTTTWRWRLPLSPSLQIGLDADLTKTGSISVPLSSRGLLANAVLSGDLLFHPPDQALDPIGGTTATDVTVGRFHADLGNLQPGSSQVVEADFLPGAGADYIPFVDDANLILRINLTALPPNLFGGGPSVAPQLVPGGQLRLPLLEYRDPVSAIFSTDSPLLFEAGSPQDRAAAPGHAVLFNLTLLNNLDVEAEAALTLSGEHSEWGALLADTPVRVPGHGRVAVPVAVHVPAGAAAGDRVDLVLQAVGTQDATQRSLARLFVLVDPAAQPAGDDAAVARLEGARSGHPTPAPAAWLAAAALLAALALRRRP
jgi:hypothetical protein